MSYDYDGIIRELKEIESGNDEFIDDYKTTTLTNRLLTHSKNIKFALSFIRNNADRLDIDMLFQNLIYSLYISLGFNYDQVLVDDYYELLTYLQRTDIFNKEELAKYKITFNEFEEPMDIVIEKYRLEQELSRF